MSIAVKQLKDLFVSLAALDTTIHTVPSDLIKNLSKISKGLEKSDQNAVLNEEQKELLIHAVFSTQTNILFFEPTPSTEFNAALTNVRKLCLDEIDPQASTLFSEYRLLTDRDRTFLIKNDPDQLKNLIQGLQQRKQFLEQCNQLGYLQTEVSGLIIDGLLKSKDPTKYVNALTQLNKQQLFLNLDIQQLNFFDQQGWIDTLIASKNLENTLYSRLNQDFLIRLMKYHHYRSSDPGMCFGLTQAWLQAVLLGSYTWEESQVNSEQEFHQRLIKLAKKLRGLELHLSTLGPLNKKDKNDRIEEYLHGTANAAKEKLQEGEILSNEEREALNDEVDTKSFFDILELLQQPERYPNILPTYLFQADIEEIYSITSSVALERRSIEPIYSETRMDNNQELKKFLNTLITISKQHHCENQKIVFGITGYQHAIGWYHDQSKNENIIFDANVMTGDYAVKDNKLAGEIKKMLHQTDYTAFSCKACVLSTHPNKQALYKALNELKNRNLEEIKPDTILRKGKNGVTPVLMGTINIDLTYLKPQFEVKGFVVIGKERGLRA